MKALSIFVAFAALLIAPMASARDAGIATTIRAMADGFNKGDIAAVKALHVVDPTIVDNVAPFVWSGGGSFDKWLGDLGKSEAAAGKSDGQVWFGDSVDEQVSGDQAYVVAPCRYTYKQGGKTMREEGFIALVMVRVGAAWKIASWSWASPAGVAAK
ncbi:nuclear transport factor 2 family protein [Sphingomonas panacisoli]|nr:nuclear transport factor 2 family protein [Sphingomonas panacisoli]